MTVKTLKQNLGETGAYTDRSSGHDNLYDVAVALAAGELPLSGRQDTVATGIIASILLDTDKIIKKLRIKVGTTGSADSTTVQVLKNAVSQGELTIANTEADGTAKALTIADVACVAGDLIELSVSAAPTAGANLVASVQLASVLVE